jgi:hypothetical protein
MASTAGLYPVQQHQTHLIQQSEYAPGIHGHQPWKAQSAGVQVLQAAGLEQQYTIPAYDNPRNQGQYGLVSELTEPNKQYGLLAEMSQPSDNQHGLPSGNEQQSKLHGQSSKPYQPMDGQERSTPGLQPHGQQYGFLSELDSANHQPGVLAGNTGTSHGHTRTTNATNQQSISSFGPPGPFIVSASVPNLRDALNNSLANSRYVVGIYQSP